METPQHECVDGITANVAVCRDMVERSIGLVTALVPVLGYKACTVLAPENMVRPRGFSAPALTS